jgi:hypothetical protein
MAMSNAQTAAIVVACFVVYFLYQWFHSPDAVAKRAANRAASVKAAKAAAKAAAAKAAAANAALAAAEAAAKAAAKAALAAAAAAAKAAAAANAAVAAGSRPGEYEYVGCYGDTAADRSFKVDAGYMEFDKCVDYAKKDNHPYFGYQYSQGRGDGQCWVGGSEYAKHGLKPGCKAQVHPSSGYKYYDAAAHQNSVYKNLQYT